MKYLNLTFVIMTLIFTLCDAASSQAMPAQINGATTDGAGTEVRPTAESGGANNPKFKIRAKRTSSDSDSGYYKWEIFGGYQYLVTEDSYRMHSITVSAGGNFHKYIGAKVEATRSRGERTTLDGNFQVHSGRDQFLGGLQIKNNSRTTTVKPFVNALAGLAVLRQRNCSNVDAGCIIVDGGSNHFIMSIGGGLDVRLNRRMDVRLFQVNYDPIRYDSNFWGHTFRIGVGLVFH